MKVKKYTENKLTKDQLVEIFINNPQKSNMELGAELGVSRERIRQLKNQFGLPGVREFNQDTFRKALIAIENGYGNLNSNLFKHIPNFAVTKLKAWMKEDPEVKRQVEIALKKAYKRNYNPDFKVCKQCNVNKPIEDFYVSKDGRDRRNRKCNPCNKKTVQEYYKKRNVTEPSVKEKTCSMLKELGPLPAEFFYKSRKTGTGLQYSCKQYQNSYTKYRNEYLKILKNPNQSEKNLLLSQLGNWKLKAKQEAKAQVELDLARIELDKIHTAELIEAGINLS